MKLMKRSVGIVGVAFFVLSFNSQAQVADISSLIDRGVTAPVMTLAGQPEILGGDAGLACEMILCLAAVGAAPSACKSPLKKYFSLKPKKRPRFLAKCPKVSG
jgi:hypothetical protein